MRPALLALLLPACGPSAEEVDRAEAVAGLIGDAEAGSALFATGCASCHGADGTGGSGPDLLPVASWPTDEVVLVLLQGPWSMPSFADWSDQELADVTAHVQIGL